MMGFSSMAPWGVEISLEVILYCARNVLLINYTRFFLTGKVEMKVCKFGGSSLADARQLTKVIDIVLADPSAASWWYPHPASATGPTPRSPIF